MAVAKDIVCIFNGDGHTLSATLSVIVRVVLPHSAHKLHNTSEHFVDLFVSMSQYTRLVLLSPSPETSFKMPELNL